MSDNINVSVRIRPLIRREIEEKQKIKWGSDNATIYSLDSNERGSQESYTFDHVFDADTKNEEIYRSVVHPAIKSAAQGINATIFAYGQTSSGKTYTMTGNAEEPGIITHSVNNLISLIKADIYRKYLLRVAYIEIYNEKLNDLLSREAKEVKIREDYHGNIIVTSTEVVVTNTDEILEKLQYGNRNRQTGETNMNERSSRGHAIFKIIIESTTVEFGGGPTQTSTINLVDLAGSERANMTGASTSRLKEGGHINKSLSTLTLVIKQISDGVPFINFRDSKLTRILQQSLGGNSIATLIAAITPVDHETTVSTLAFAQRAKTITNKPVVNVGQQEALINKYVDEINLLKSQLSKAHDTNQNLARSKGELQDRLIVLEKNFVTSAPPKRRHTFCEGVTVRSEEDAAKRVRFFANTIDEEATTSAISVPVFVPKPEPVFEEDSEPVFEEVSEPVFEEVSEPVFEEVSEPVMQNFEQPLSDSDEDVYDLRNLRMSWNQSYETQTYTNYECAFVRRETIYDLRAQNRVLLQSCSDQSIAIYNLETENNCNKNALTQMNQSNLQLQRKLEEAQQKIRAMEVAHANVLHEKDQQYKNREQELLSLVPNDNSNCARTVLIDFICFLYKNIGKRSMTSLLVQSCLNLLLGMRELNVYYISDGFANIVDEINRLINVVQTYQPKKLVDEQIALLNAFVAKIRGNASSADSDLLAQGTSVRDPTMFRQPNLCPTYSILGRYPTAQEAQAEFARIEAFLRDNTAQYGDSTINIRDSEPDVRRTDSDYQDSESEEDDNTESRSGDLNLTVEIILPRPEAPQSNARPHSASSEITVREELPNNNPAIEECNCNFRRTCDKLQRIRKQLFKRIQGMNRLLTINQDKLSFVRVTYTKLQSKYVKLRKLNAEVGSENQAFEDEIKNTKSLLDDMQLEYERILTENENLVQENNRIKVDDSEYQRIIKEHDNLMKENDRLKDIESEYERILSENNNLLKNNGKLQDAYTDYQRIISEKRNLIDSYNRLKITFENLKITNLQLESEINNANVVTEQNISQLNKEILQLKAEKVDKECEYNKLIEQYIQKINEQNITIEQTISNNLAFQETLKEHLAEIKNLKDALMSDAQVKLHLVENIDSLKEKCAKLEALNQTSPRQNEHIKSILEEQKTNTSTCKNCANLKEQVDFYTKHYTIEKFKNKKYKEKLEKTEKTGTKDCAKCATLTKTLKARDESISRRKSELTKLDARKKELKGQHRQEIDGFKIKIQALENEINNRDPKPSCSQENKSVQVGKTKFNTETDPEKVTINKAVFMKQQSDYDAIKNIARTRKKKILDLETELKKLKK